MVKSECGVMNKKKKSDEDEWENLRWGCIERYGVEWKQATYRLLFAYGINSFARKRGVLLLEIVTKETERNKV